MSTACSLWGLALLFLANRAGNVGKKKSKSFLTHQDKKMTGVAMKSLCASLICENKNSYFSEGRAAHLLLGKHHMARLQWAVSLRWFAELFSGVKEEEG